jgi:hypothetical protein
MARIEMEEVSYLNEQVIPKYAKDPSLNRWKMKFEEMSEGWGRSAEWEKRGGSSFFVLLLRPNKDKPPY